MSYECHITVDVKDAEKATLVANELHWKTSEIARDPVLGDKNYFYLTAHSTDFPAIWNKMEKTRNTLIHYGVLVIREKIELIIYDTKTKK